MARFITASGIGEALIANCDPAAPADCSADDLAALFYTGGTTGRSKGVMLSHANLCYNAMQMLTLYMDVSGWQDGTGRLVEVTCLGTIVFVCFSGIVFEFS